MNRSLGVLVAEGQTSDVHRFGDGAIVKLLKATTPRSWAADEAAFTRAVDQVGLPVPGVFDLVEVDGRPGIVFEQVTGPSMWQRMMERPSDVDALIGELVDLQRAVHDATIPDGLPSLVERTRAKVADVAEFDDADRVRAAVLLREVPTGASVLHGDLHPGNVLLGADGPVLIDWFDASVGHRAGDIERTSMLLSPSGLTDLRHLPGANGDVVARAHRAYLDAQEDEPSRRVWRALVVASRLAERTDLDSAGLLAQWRFHGDDAVKRFGPKAPS